MNITIPREKGEDTIQLAFSREGEDQSQSSVATPSEVEFHKHCQKTILPIIGHPDTVRLLDDFSAEIKSDFANSKNLAEDLATIIEVVNRYAKKSGKITFTIKDTDSEVVTGTATIYPDQELTDSYSQNVVSIGRTVELDIGGAKVKFRTAQEGGGNDNLTSVLPKKKLMLNGEQLGEVVVPEYQGWEDNTDNLVISANSISFKFNGAPMGSAIVATTSSSTIDFDVPTLDQNKIICEDVAIQQDGKATLNLTSIITGYRITATRNFTPFINLRDYWENEQGETNPNSKYIIQIQMFVNNPNEEGTISVGTPKVGDVAGFDRMYSKIDINAGQSGVIKITIDLGRKTIVQEAVKMFPPTGETIKNEGLFVYASNKIITGYNSSATQEDLNDEIYDTYAVGIGAQAFIDQDQNRSPTQIYLPYVTTIESSAFYGCSLLFNIGISNVKTIGNDAFVGCNSTSFTELNLPVATSIGNNAFKDCTNLKTITLQKVSSNTSIGTGAFENCLSLETIDFSLLPFASVYGKYSSWKLPGNVLLKCKDKTIYSPQPYLSYDNATSRKITKVIGTIPDGKVVDMFALGTSNATFSNRTDIQEIDFPNATTIGKQAFCSCTSLATISLPSVTTVGQQAFMGCVSLQAAPFPNATEIGTQAFQGCTSLETANIPNVGTIPESAFQGCTRLRNIVTRPGVSVPEPNAFYGCPQLADSNGLVIVGSVVQSVCGNKTQITVPSTVKGINKFAFSGNTTVINVDLPDGIESIGANAFESCSGLTMISIPDTVTTLGANAFKNCTSLETIYLGSGVTTVANTVFAGCTAMKNVTVPSAVCANATNFKSVFGGNQTIVQAVTIPLNTMSLAVGIFTGFNNLSCLTVPFVGLSNGSSGSNALFGKLFATAATSGKTYQVKQNYNTTTTQFTCHVPSSLTSVCVTGGSQIGYGAFMNMSTLTTITIPSTVSSIGTSAFYGCGGLNKITIYGKTQEEATSILEGTGIDLDVVEIDLPDDLS